MAVAAAEAEDAAVGDAAAGDAAAAEAEAAAALEAASGAAAAAAAVAEAVACPGAPAPCARLHSRPVADELNQKSRPAANSRAAPSWRHPTSSLVASQFRAFSDDLTFAVVSATPAVGAITADDA
jgi:hypothetical protein